MTTKPEYEIVYQDIMTLLYKHSDKVTGLELLAIASNIVGKLVALQDHRFVTKEKALAIVSENLQNGNKQMIEDLMSSKNKIMH